MEQCGWDVAERAARRVLVLGLYDSLILVIPSLEMVAARAGKSWQRDGWDSHYGALAPFFDPIAAAVPAASRVRRVAFAAPYPQSERIRAIQWDPPEEIVRAAKGSDNWPIPWANDDLLYAAYSDGSGFEPRVERKLSLGLAVVPGEALDFEGHNLRSAGAERLGDGASGEKASGMLMVDGVLPCWCAMRTIPNWHGREIASSFPVKWMSQDGRVLHLVFSGEDHFSVRRGVLVLDSR